MITQVLNIDQRSLCVDLINFVLFVGPDQSQRIVWFRVSLNDSHLEGIYEVEGSADATIVDETIAGEGNTLVRFAFVDVYQFYFAVLGCDNDQFGKDLRHRYRTDGGIVLYFTLKCYILRLQSVVP